MLKFLSLGSYGNRFVKMSGCAPDERTSKYSREKKIYMKCLVRVIILVCLVFERN